VFPAAAWSLLASAAVFFLIGAGPLPAQKFSANDPGLIAPNKPLPDELDGAQIREHLGRQLDLDLQFTAENGYPVPLRSFFHDGRPVLLNFVYYRCPMLCNLVLNGQTAALKELAWTPGNEFEVVTITVNPAETFDLARQKKQQYLDLYERPTTGWHFLTDYQNNVRKLADEAGFGYKWDERQQQYAHQAGIIVVTPDGRVSRYLYGIKFRARDLRIALNEAAAGKLGNTLDKIVFYCFHYDPAAKSYVPFARNIMRLGGVLMILVLGGAIAIWVRHERQNRTPADMVLTK